ncbi:hypothetical protein [Dactylosporangium cerinum]
MAVAAALDARWARTSGLTGLLPHLPAGSRAAVRAGALDDAVAHFEHDHSGRSLAGLAPHLPACLLRHALALVSAAPGYRDAWGQALRGLAPHLPAGLRRRELLAAVMATPHQEGLVRTVVAVARFLPGDARAVAVARALDLLVEPGGQYWRGWGFAGLARYLSPEQLDRATGAALATTSERARARAIAGLAPYLPAARRHQVIAAAAAVVDPPDRALALTALAAHPSADAVPRAVRGGRPDSGAAQDERAAVLAQAWRAACLIGDPQRRSQALARLVPYLPDGERAGAVAAALDAARDIQDEYDRGRALRRLGPLLPTELHDPALAVAQSITSSHARGTAVARLAAHLPPALLPRCAALAPDADTMAAVARATRSTPGSATIAAWVGVLRAALDAPDREIALAALAELAPVVVSGATSHDPFIAAVLQTAAWWR